MAAQQTLSITDRHGIVYLVNGTPWNWTLSHIHEYQMPQWGWPKTVLAKSAVAVPVAFSHSITVDAWHDGGEADYTFTCKGTQHTFSIHARSVGTHNDNTTHEIRLAYGTGFVGVPAGAEITQGVISTEELHIGTLDWIACCISGYDSGSGAVLWGPNHPSDWMQRQLPILGNSTLRQISMPYSHDAGMSGSLQYLTKLCNTGNSRTQNASIGAQLEMGARYFDLRPCLFRGSYSIAHAGYVDKLIGWQGAIGQTLQSICAEINEFTRTNSELLIFELSHCMVAAGPKGEEMETMVNMTQSQYDALFRYLRGEVNHLYHVAHWTADLTQVPLKEFIGSGQPAVIFALSDDNISLGTYQGAGFYYGCITGAPSLEDNAPVAQVYYTGDYTNSTNVKTIFNYQYGKMSKLRQNPTRPPFLLEWTATLATLKDQLDLTIASATKEVQPELYMSLLGMTSLNSYPTLIGTDFIIPSVTPLAFAMNMQYAQYVKYPFESSIEAAYYGDGSTTNRVDVTAFLSNAYEMWKTHSSSSSNFAIPFSINVTTEGLRVTDPASGARKRLDVLLRKWSLETPCVSYAMCFTAFEDDSLILDPRNITMEGSKAETAAWGESPLSSFDVVAATYGPVDPRSTGVKDVTKIVVAMQGNNGSFNISNDTMDGDPSPGNPKILQVLMAGHGLDPLQTVYFVRYAKENQLFTWPEVGEKVL